MDKINLLELQAFGRKKQAVFAYLCCLRVYKHCTDFATEYNYGRPQVFKEAVEFMYVSLVARNIGGSSEISTHIDAIEENGANTNDIPNYDATIAMDCAAVIYYSLMVLSEFDTAKSLEYLVTSIIDAVDCYIQERDDMDPNVPDLNDQIDSDPIMVGEYKIQNELIDNLKLLTSIDKDVIDQLVEFQKPYVLDLRLKDN